MTDRPHHRVAVSILNHLTAFEASARLGSFRAAAEEMFVTPGAVAQQVRALEDKLGVELFDRLPRGLRPNRTGADYVNRVRLALGIIEEATADLLDRGNEREPNQVILSTTATFASRWLIPRLKRLEEANPDIVVMIDASDTPRALKGNGSVDMAIRWGTPPFSEGHTQFMLSGRAIPVCAPSLLEKNKWASPRDLMDATLISDSHNNWKRWFDVMGILGLRSQGLFSHRLI